MKKITFFVLLLLVSTALIYATDKATVISFTGKAEYQTEQGWSPLTVGAVLDQGTVISTGFKSSVVLTVGDSQFTVAALSRVTISKLLENDSNYDTEMNLTTGKLKMNVRSKPGKKVAFTVRSPTATASVRGTSGIMSAAGDLQSLTGTWVSLAREGTKEIKVTGRQSAKITGTTTISAPQQTRIMSSTITEATTSKLSTQEIVTTSGTVATTTSQPLNTGTTSPEAPSTGSISVSVTLPN